MTDSTNDHEKSRRADIPAAAQRALREADARRKAALADAGSAPPEKELGGPKGQEPTRYGDWEKGGRAVDF